MRPRQTRPGEDVRKGMQLLRTRAEGRVGLIDEVRGFAILCMVVYHGVYDFLVLFDVDFPFFFSPLMNGVRDLFAAAFVFISGTACRYSRNNLRRGALCFGLGLAMTVFTLAFVPDERIWFGILHMLGVSMMLFGLFGRVLDRLRPWLGLVACFVLFFLTWHVVDGYLGLFGLRFAELPPAWYETGFLFPLGFVGDGFYSADFFPLLPWLFMFLAGAYAGVYLRQNRLPAGFYKTHSAPLALVGRNTLLIYVLHQPVVYGILWLLSSIV